MSPCPASYLTVNPFNDIVCADLQPMLRRKIHVGQGFFNTILYLFGCLIQPHGT